SAKRLQRRERWTWRCVPVARAGRWRGNPSSGLQRPAAIEKMPATHNPGLCVLRGRPPPRHSCDGAGPRVPAKGRWPLSAARPQRSRKIIFGGGARIHGSAHGPPTMSDEKPSTSESAQAFRQAALDYHRLEPRGKIKVVATKPMLTQRDLALAYSPGVAYACEEIAADPTKASDYTARGNLVAVISNGTAVLGLGDIGPLAGKPVM